MIKRNYFNNTCIAYGLSSIVTDMHSYTPTPIYSPSSFLQHTKPDSDNIGAYFCSISNAFEAWHYSGCKIPALVKHSITLVNGTTSERGIF
jgi:hypothetical protein